MSVQENIAALNGALEAVRSHCMCAELVDTQSHYIIYYPDGDFPVGGIRCDRSAAGLKQALPKMEQHWLQSFPGYAVS